MAIPNLYWWNRGGFTGTTGTPSVFELVNGTQLSLIGDADIGNGLEGGFTDEFNGTNCILEFQGKRYLWHKEFIKEENQGGTGNWGTVHTTAATSGTNIKSGLFVVLRNGVPNMVGMAVGSGGFRTAFRFDGTTWTNVSVAGGPIRGGVAITYNNKLFWNVIDFTYVYDPIDDSIQTYNFGGAFDTVEKDFCVLNGELFAAGYNNDSGAPPQSSAKLWRFDDTGWTVVHTFNTTPFIEWGGFGHPVLFSPNNQSLVFISHGEDAASDVGDQAALIQNPGTASQIVTDITDPVIPAQFRPLGANAVGTARFAMFADTQNSASPTSPDFYIWRLASPTAGNWGFYIYTDTSTELAYQGVGPSWQYIGPHIKQGGQGRISGGATASSTNKVYAAMENPVISSTLGSMDISFRVYGTATNLEGRVYVSSEHETPDTQITISSVSGGSATVASNVISNITADDGATLYTFTWSANVDGITDGVPVTLVMDLTT